MELHRDSAPPGAGKSSFDLADRRRLSDALPLRAGQKVVDLGCGAGLYAIAMAERVGPAGRVFAVDLWEGGLSCLQQAIREAGLGNISVLRADITKPLPIPGDSIDVILMATVLHDLKAGDARDGALAEVRRLLKRHGTLVILEFQKKAGPPGPPEPVRLAPGDVEDHVVPFGFVKTGLHEIGPHLYLMSFVPKVACNA